MLNLFFHNWKTNSSGFNPASPAKWSMQKLIGLIASAARVPPFEVQIYFVDDSYTVWFTESYKADPEVSFHHGLHVEVDWHKGRDPEQKFGVATAIHNFCLDNDIATNMDITFNDYPNHSFFIEENEEIEEVLLTPKK